MRGKNFPVGKVLETFVCHIHMGFLTMTEDKSLTQDNPSETTVAITGRIQEAGHAS